MVVEMDIGIICACLSGVKPVMAVVFPKLFGSSYNKSRSATRPSYGLTGRSNALQSSAFHPLTDISSKNRDKKVENISIDAMDPSVPKEQRNFAWAASSGSFGPPSSVPAGAIGVQQVVTVEEEQSGSVTPHSDRDTKANNLSDAGSEEWIMDDVPKKRRI